MEVEYPLDGIHLDLPALKKNLTYQVDTFFYDTDFGLRWEKRRPDQQMMAWEMLSSKYMKYTEL